MATLRPNDVLVLPEDEQPYEVDSSRGFQMTSRNFHSMAYLQRGLVGLGPGAVVQPSASAFGRGRQTYTQGMQEKMIECRAASAYLGNFTMYGRDFGGVGYNATRMTGTGATWERIYFRGAHRGWLAVPPGEAGAITGYKGSGMRVYNCEIDCRDQSGLSVGTSPMMWNAQSDVQVADAYCHHTYVGMPTFWKVNDAIATNLIHTNVAQGAPYSPGVNVEQSSGHFQFNDCTFIIDYGTHNRRFHLQAGKQPSSIRFDIRNPTIDAGPWPGDFSIQTSPGSPQLVSDIHITRANGSAYPFRVAGL
ncbi:hypothetical protein [Leekyejoonella antrihumi]|uniref:Right-handed parallel beta-helix repeat-containing protein n=1 Tax=Leekyejoonella antrihumi TaxID=1660198 RepID=A0A563DTI3_9MICO|nr:hypothetical protein [Leekyejoonella antrihumi]TWP33479.1 hypothetical protein FGL98_21205 [Leekyejoonella antrihumi]